MSKVSQVHLQLTNEEQKKLNCKLIDRKFSGLSEIVAELASEGFEISRSSLGRYSKNLKDKTNRIREGREASKVIVEAIPDDENHQAEALLALTMQTMFDLLLELKIDTNKLKGEEGTKFIKSLSSMSISASKIANSIINLKKYKQETRERLEQANNQIKETLTDDGVPDETMRKVEEALGAVL